MTENQSDQKISNEANKISVLLHYDKAFREDWRFLSRLRILWGGIFIGLATSNLGWMMNKFDSSITFQDRFPHLILHSILSIVAI